ncbi:hypothetical protein EDD17DRAFT_1627968 [Pisolithus thermaeus]|nr:hypothetical protein EDD17DRAFT_1627968 [Pisolithus thermaeus]
MTLALSCCSDLIILEPIFLWAAALQAQFFFFPPQFFVVGDGEVHTTISECRNEVRNSQHRDTSDLKVVSPQGRTGAIQARDIKCSQVSIHWVDTMLGRPGP